MYRLRSMVSSSILVSPYTGSFCLDSESHSFARRVSGPGSGWVWMETPRSGGYDECALLLFDSWGRRFNLATVREGTGCDVKSLCRLHCN